MIKRPMSLYQICTGYIELCLQQWNELFQSEYNLNIHEIINIINLYVSSRRSDYSFSVT